MATLRCILIGLVLAALATAPLSLVAQAGPRAKLRPADAKLDHEFTRIGTVRELRDGRVLVTDPGEKRLHVVDFAARTVEPVGRTGAGPGEYSVPPYRLFPLAADSTLLADAGARRWLLLVGARIVATVPADNPVVVASRGVALGTDQVGRLASFHYAGRSGGDPAAQIDSPHLVLVDRANAHVDTVGRLRPPQTVFSKMIRGADGREIPYYTGGPFYDAFEQAVTFPDGWTAVARLFPYRVDWLRRDGRWQLGVPLAGPTPLSAREKQAYMNRNARRAGRTPGNPDNIALWPSTIPEFFGFDPVVLLAEPAGRLVVRRTPTADHEETRYDFVDRAGKLSLQLSMVETERIVGFGVKSAYVAWKDADDIERLRRHPWP